MTYRRWTRILFWLVPLLLFATSGIQGEVRDMAWEGNLLAVAVGEHGGVRVLEMSDPSHPQEVGAFDTLGPAQAVAWLNNRLLVADGNAGLEVLDAADPTRLREVAVFAPGHAVLDVSADPTRNLAFLALGAGGMSILDLSDPASPAEVARWQTEEAIRRVVYHEGRVYALGDEQLWVVDVFSPEQAQVWGATGHHGAVDVTVVGQDVAVGAFGNGVRVFQSALGGSFPAVDFPPKEAGDVPLFPATAVAAYGRSVIAGSARGELFWISLLDPAQPQAQGELPSLPWPVTALAVQGDQLAVGGGPFGVLFYNLRTPDAPPFAWYDTRGEYAIPQMWKVLRAGIRDPRPFVARKTGHTLLVWLGLLGVWLVARYAAALFFAQFVLPLHTFEERWNAFRHLNLYIRGRHGPALFVENGELIEREGEREKQGPGVIILDTASAAMLRTKTQYTRAVGPGVVFTDANEFVEATVPLFPRFQGLGPSSSIDMDAFEDALAGGENPPYPEALETRAQTRDDVAVVARIGVTFRLDFDPPQGTQTMGRSRYGFQAEVVSKAVRGSRVDPTRDPDTEPPELPWDQLPALIAVELWREYLQKFRFNELFDPSTGKRLGLAKDSSSEAWGETGLEIIRRFVRARMTQPEVQPLDNEGRPLPGVPPVKSQEYELLKERGIRVLSVSITQLQFRASVERNLLRAWQSSWLDWVEQESRHVEERRAYAEHQGREDGERIFAMSVTHTLGRYLTYQRKPAEDHECPLPLDALQQGVPEREWLRTRALALRWLARDTWRLLVHEPQVHKALEGVEEELSQLYAYIQRWKEEWS